MPFRKGEVLVVEESQKVVSENSKAPGCIYCGLKLRGKGCIYSPSKVHIHPTADKCIYCGLTLRGKGCQYSPSGAHMRFFDFSGLQQEQAQSQLMFTYIVEKLKQPYIESAAYKLGIIDESGYQIKNPETIMEQRSYSQLDKYIFRLKRVFGEGIKSVNSEMLIESAVRSSTVLGEDFDPAKYSETVDIEHNIKIKLESAVSEYYNCIREASKLGVSTLRVEQILTQVLLENDDTKQNIDK